MEFDNIECISSSDGIDEDEPSFSKPHVPSTISLATSVHELLECPVCTNSMYPPIHQKTTAPFLRGLIRRFLASRISKPDPPSSEETMQPDASLGNESESKEKLGKGTAATTTREKYNLEAIAAFLVCIP
ncbi:E3 ubiquitin-protein ligase [Nymphaea thermarum]|nr:E3 ubiquitin-protein ligase [Nymphaea thermarum]